MLIIFQNFAFNEWLRGSETTGWLFKLHGRQTRLSQ